MSSYSLPVARMNPDVASFIKAGVFKHTTSTPSIVAPEKSLDISDAILNRSAMGNSVAASRVMNTNITDGVEKIFNSRISLKVYLSQFSMHLTSGERGRLFSEIDYLLDSDGWDPEDDLPKLHSFKDFVTWCIFARTKFLSSLGLTHDGLLLAAWTSEVSLLTVRFRGQRLIDWSYQSRSDEASDNASGTSNLAAFGKIFALYMEPAA